MTKWDIIRNEYIYKKECRGNGYSRKKWERINWDALDVFSR